MVYKALTSFAGVISMCTGEVTTIEDEAVAKDLLQAGYIELVKSEAKAEPEPEAEAKAEPVKRGASLKHLRAKL
jgi:hypothetical protein